MTTTKRERDAQAADRVLYETGLSDREFVHLPAKIDESALRRFWSKVKVEDGHWLWTATTGKDGIGKFCPYEGTFYPAHRLAWMLLRGEIQSSDYLMLVPEKCGFRHCINPDHRHVGTASEATRKGGRTRAKAGGQPVNCSQKMVDTLAALHAAGRDIWPACRHINLGPAAMEQIKKGNAIGV